MHIYFNSGGSFWNCEPREWAFLCQSRTLCNIQLLLSLSFSLPLLPSPSQNSGKLDLRAASVFLLKAPHREPAGFTWSQLFAFWFLPTLTICTEHEWTRVLVFLFSAQPPSFFVTLTTEAEWRGLGAGEHIGRHSGNTGNKHLDLCEDDTQLWETQHSEVIDKHCNKNPWAASLHCKNTSGADP